MDILDELKRIDSANFFSALGNRDLDEADIMFAENVSAAFISPLDDQLRGCHKEVEWLPSSPTQSDPFYRLDKPTKELTALRKEINKGVTVAIRGIDNKQFICPPHDFSAVAKHAICFAFRQLVTERYFSLGDKWDRITTLYYAGHWPVGVIHHKYLVI